MSNYSIESFISPQKWSKFPERAGFTLVELLVASVAASVISLAALQVYSQYHKLYMYLYGDYQKETAAILKELRRINPYVSGTSLRR